MLSEAILLSTAIGAITKLVWDTVVSSKDKKHILVIEKDELIQNNLKTALINEGFVISVASDFKDVLDVLHSHTPPNLILLDWNIPVELPSIIGVPPIPVLIISKDTPKRISIVEKGINLNIAISNIKDVIGV